MNNQLWNILEEPNSYRHIEDHDMCFYARQYRAGGHGYQGGRTNQLILNFKKPPIKKTTSEWTHRTSAIETFAMETEQLPKVASITEQLPRMATITAIPSSKTKNHPEYDNRFEDFFDRLLQSHPYLLRSS